MVSDLILEDNGVTISGDKDQLIKIESDITIKSGSGEIYLLPYHDKHIWVRGHIKGYNQDPAGCDPEEDFVNFDSKINANLGIKVDRLDVNEIHSSSNGFVNIDGYIVTDYGLETSDILSKDLKSDITIKSGSGEIYLLPHLKKHIWVRGHIKGYNQDPGGYDPEGDFVNFDSKINAKYGIKANQIECSRSMNLRINKDQFEKTIKLSFIEFQEQEREQKGIKIELADANTAEKGEPIPDRQCNFILTGDKILIEIIESVKPKYFTKPIKQTSYIDLVSVIRNLQNKLGI